MNVRPWPMIFLICATGCSAPKHEGGLADTPYWRFSTLDRVEKNLVHGFGLRSARRPALVRIYGLSPDEEERPSVSFGEVKSYEYMEQTEVLRTTAEGRYLKIEIEESSADWPNKIDVTVGGKTYRTRYEATDHPTYILAPRLPDGNGKSYETHSPSQWTWVILTSLDKQATKLEFPYGGHILTKVYLENRQPVATLVALKPEGKFGIKIAGKLLKLRSGAVNRV